MFVLSVLEAPNTNTNSLCANTLGNKALSDCDSEFKQIINKTIIKINLIQVTAAGLSKRLIIINNTI